MNNFPSMTIVGWETRNWRHRDRALIYCKDYGLKPITRHVYIGETYPKERVEMHAKFRKLFTSKTEKFFFTTVCKSCFNEGMSGIKFKQEPIENSHFELVQMPKNAGK